MCNAEGLALTNYCIIDVERSPSSGLGKIQFCSCKILVSLDALTNQKFQESSEFACSNTWCFKNGQIVYV